MTSINQKFVKQQKTITSSTPAAMLADKKLIEGKSIIHHPLIIIFHQIDK